MAKKLQIPKNKTVRKPCWLDKYEVIGIVPGIIVTQKGKIDLTNENIPLETIENLINEGCPFLKLKKQALPE